MIILLNLMKIKRFTITTLGCFLNNTIKTIKSNIEIQSKEKFIRKLLEINLIKLLEYKKDEV